MSSPRVRLLVLAVVVLALAAAGVALTRGTPGSGGAAGLPGPSADPAQQGPVLLIPGYGGGTQLLGPAADRLRALGYDVEIVTIAATSPEGQPLVRKVVTLASPHEETRQAALGQEVGQGPRLAPLEPDQCFVAAGYDGGEPVWTGFSRRGSWPSGLRTPLR